jgi:hypothetical protein
MNVVMIATEPSWVNERASKIHISLRPVFFWWRIFGRWWEIFTLWWQIVFGNLSILEIFIRGFRDLQSYPFREGHSEPGPTGAP